MLKHFAVMATAFALLAPVSAAQSAADVAKATSGQSCIDCNLFQVDLSYKDIQGVSFAGARLRQSDLTIAVMDRVNFERANLSIANLYGARFSGASFRNADLSRAILVGASFDGANFEAANLSEANISGAEMATAVGLSQSQLNMACGDQYTKLPTGLSVQHCR